MTLYSKLMTMDYKAGTIVPEEHAKEYNYYLEIKKI